jgi:hypothetical protein
LDDRADYAPNPAELELVEKAFPRAGTDLGTNLNARGSKTDSLPVRERPTSGLDGAA